MGNPIMWTPTRKKEAFDQILLKLSAGESLRKTLRNGKRMPSMWTFIQWMKYNKEMHSDYLFACGERADKLFEEILHIIDNVKPDRMEIRKAILQVDARKWVIGKMHKFKQRHPDTK
jgi:hypothetical protein